MGSGGFRKAISPVGFALCLAACGESGSASGGGQVEITGRLVSGFASEGVRMGVRQGVRLDAEEGVRAGQQEGVRTSCDRKLTSLDSGWALPGYSLYCVTFATSPAAGSGKGDGDGRFALRLASSGAPVGCFVLDLAGDRVADLFFQRDQRGPDGHLYMTGSARLDSDTDLGDIWVDEYTTVALAELGSPSTHNGSAHWDPTGTWAFAGCLDAREDKPCPAIEEAFYAAYTAEFPAFYFNRLSGTDLDTGAPRYLADAWLTHDHFRACGETEGLSSSMARDIHRMELDAAAATSPLRFRSEPPGGESWDPTDTCTGPVDWKGTRAKCAVTTDPARRASCYYDFPDGCLAERARTDSTTCYPSWFVDEAYMDRYLTALDRGEAPAFELDRYLTLRDVAYASIRNTLGRKSYLPEMIYSGPNTWSAAVFTIDEIFPVDSTGKSRACDIAFDAQLNVTRQAEDLAVIGLILSANVSPTAPDFEWCKANVKQASVFPVPPGLSLRLRAQARPVL